ncbi:hypothetical protein RJ641_027024 [Dillenia turbinata]|uniref:BSD2 cysteine rich domain-containing protein n=1 Tax=Dillenia turbinata TaxID=194707 RepID=A0AAN8W4X9_9MAGN
MSNSLCFIPITSFTAQNKPGILIGKSAARNAIRIKDGVHNSRTLRLQVKAADNNPSPKSSSIICPDCDGNGKQHNGYSSCFTILVYVVIVLSLDFATNLSYPLSTEHPVRRPPAHSVLCTFTKLTGAIQCSECKGSGVNSIDHFNGQFKAGGLCWLCRGKREILCGNCNGAGFVGGFMSTFDS